LSKAISFPFNLGAGHRRTFFFPPPFCAASINMDRSVPRSFWARVLADTLPFPSSFEVLFLLLAGPGQGKLPFAA